MEETQEGKAQQRLKASKAQECPRRSPELTNARFPRESPGSLLQPQQRCMAVSHLSAAQSGLLEKKVGRKKKKKKKIELISKREAPGWNGQIFGFAYSHQLW